MKDNTLYKQLDNALWVTNGCRFLSHKKYKSIYISLQILVIFLSFLLICIGILNITGNKLLTNISKENLDILLLIISIFVFSLSISLPSLSNKVNLMHENATNIASLLRMLKLAKNEKDLENISNNYDRYLIQTNHDTIDFNRWSDTIENPKYNHGKIEAFLYLIVWHFYSKFVYILFLMTIFTYLIIA